MAILEVKGGNPSEAIQELLCSMLSRGLVSAVMAPQEIPSGKTVAQTLVRKAERLTAVNPLAPVFGVNSARIIARMCVQQTAALAEAAPGREEQPAVEKPSHPIAVVLRPCEVRALVELVKLRQASMDPFLVIGVDCWGTYAVQDYAAKVEQSPQGSSVTAEFLKQAAAGNFPGELRGACRGCQHPVPTYADIAIQLIGQDINREIMVKACTEKGKAVFAALALEETPDSSERAAAVSKLNETKKQLAEKDQLDFLELISSLCINCHNCQSVCPICYCKQCLFDGKVFEYPLEKYLTWADKSGALGMPTDKLLFHLTRMSHVAASCVACGQCEAACPSGIPLGRIYRKISAAAQEALGYEAGRSLDDELPLTTYREDELSIVES